MTKIFKRDRDYSIKCVEGEGSYLMLDGIVIASSQKPTQLYQKLWDLYGGDPVTDDDFIEQKHRNFTKIKKDLKRVAISLRKRIFHFKGSYPGLYPDR